MPHVEDSKYQTASILGFLGQQEIKSLFAYLQHVEQQRGRPITIGEYRVVCSKLVSVRGCENLANPEVQDQVFQAYQFQSMRWPVGAPRTTCLPLDRRRGGEIRLTEEQAQLAMSQGPSADLDNLRLRQSAPTSFVPPKTIGDYPPSYAHKSTWVTWVKEDQK